MHIVQYFVLFYLIISTDFEQNERPPLPASCQPALAHLIKRCWSANPSKRPDFSDIVCTLEKYDECVKEGLPLTHHSGLVNKNVIIERLKGCVPMSSSIPVQAWFPIRYILLLFSFQSILKLISYNLNIYTCYLHMFFQLYYVTVPFSVVSKGWVISLRTNVIWATLNLQTYT